MSESSSRNNFSVIAIGTDIIECGRIARMIDRHGEQFLQRVFTRREIEYCTDRKIAYQHFSGRWAAKEAILKTLGTGWARGIQWTDVEVLSQPSGKPEVALHAQAEQVALNLGIARILISISHTKDYAVAFATAVG